MYTNAVFVVSKQQQFSIIVSGVSGCRIVSAHYMGLICLMSHLLMVLAEMNIIIVKKLLMKLFKCLTIKYLFEIIISFTKVDLYMFFLS